MKKRPESGKKWLNFNGLQTGRVSRVLEEEIRNSTCWCRVSGVETRVRPPESLYQVVPSQVQAGGAGWASGQLIWTALKVVMGQVSKEGSVAIQVEGCGAIQIVIYRKEDPP